MRTRTAWMLLALLVVGARLEAGLLGRLLEKLGKKDELPKPTSLMDRGASTQVDKAVRRMSDDAVHGKKQADTNWGRSPLVSTPTEFHPTHGTPTRK